jgi:hypothetical protein
MGDAIGRLIPHMVRHDSRGVRQTQPNSIKNTLTPSFPLACSLNQSTSKSSSKTQISTSKQQTTTPAICLANCSAAVSASSAVLNGAVFVQQPRRHLRVLPRRSTSISSRIEREDTFWSFNRIRLFAPGFLTQQAI